MKRLKWDEYFRLAQEIKEKEGSINVSGSYVYKSIRMGKWFASQRARKRELNENQIGKLDSLGFEWDGRSTHRYNIEMHFQDMLKLLIEYKEANGNTRIPADYEIDGIKLGKWAQNIRRILRNTSNRGLSEEKRKALLDLGFEYDWYAGSGDETWGRKFDLLKELLQEYELPEIVEGFLYKGVRIGSWIHHQRNMYKAGRLSHDRLEKLQSIGFDFSPNADRWDKAFLKAESFYKEFNHLEVPYGFIVDGFDLGRWISNQRQVFNGTRTDMKLSAEQISRLDSIGMSWKSSSAGNTSFAEQALIYYLGKEFSDLTSRDKSNGFELDIYVPSIRTALEYDGFHWHKDKMSADNKKDCACADLGIKLVRIREKPLAETKSAVCYYRDDTDSIHSLESVISNVLVNEFGKCIDVDITRDSRSILRDFMRFSSKNWYSCYEEAKAYYQKHGDLLVPYGYVTERNVTLGKWIANQRSVFKGNSQTNHLTDNEIRLLEEIGMVWDVLELRWNKYYRIATEYFKEHGNLLVPRNMIYQGVPLGRWINTQRNDHNLLYRKNKRMNVDRIKRLESIGMVWNTKAKQG